MVGCHTQADSRDVQLLLLKQILDLQLTAAHRQWTISRFLSPLRRRGTEGLESEVGLLASGGWEGTRPERRRFPVFFREIWVVYMGLL